MAPEMLPSKVLRELLVAVCLFAALLFAPGCAQEASYWPGIGTKEVSFEQIRYYIQPGDSTKADIETILGKPSRVTTTDSGEEIWTYYYQEFRTTGGFIWALQNTIDTKWDLASIHFERDGTVKTAYRSRTYEEMPPLACSGLKESLFPSGPSFWEEEMHQKGKGDLLTFSSLAPDLGQGRFFLPEKCPSPEDAVATVRTGDVTSTIHVVDMQEVPAGTHAVKLLPGPHLIDVSYFDVGGGLDWVSATWTESDLTLPIKAIAGHEYLISVTLSKVEGKEKPRAQGVTTAKPVTRFIKYFPAGGATYGPSSVGRIASAGAVIGAAIVSELLPREDLQAEAAIRDVTAEGPDDSSGQRSE